MSNSLPIGVFDSGLGGLTVVKALKDLMPNENIIYFGDTAHIPYGTKSTETVTHYSKQITGFLSDKNVKLIVVACNTASALALPAIKQTFDIPMIGVIEPGAEAAVNTTKSGVIGVIGTISTISSGAYSSRIRNLNSNLITSGQACPLFVPLAEEGWTTGNVPRMIAETYLNYFNSNNVDTVILGCTHYPLLKKTIQSVLNPGVQLIDSSEAVSEAVAKLLHDKDNEANKEKDGTLTCYVTDMPQKFEELGRRFLGEALLDVSLVHLDW